MLNNQMALLLISVRVNVIFCRTNTLLKYDNFVKGDRRKDKRGQVEAQVESQARRLAEGSLL
jgi:predicted nucleotidyltransferase